MSTGVCWELTCDGLVSRPRGVKDSHPLNTTLKREISARSMGLLARIGFRNLVHYNRYFNSQSFFARIEEANIYGLYSSAVFSALYDFNNLLTFLLNV